MLKKFILIISIVMGAITTPSVLAKTSSGDDSTNTIQSISYCLNVGSDAMLCLITRSS